MKILLVWLDSDLWNVGLWSYFKGLCPSFVAFGFRIFCSGCSCMPDHIWMHEINHIEKAICLLEMWRDIWSQIALKCIQGFIKERSYLTAQSVTRHFKVFKPFATFDAGKWLFSFVNPCVYFKQMCACMPDHIWMHEMYNIKKAICLLEMSHMGWCGAPASHPGC